MGIMSSERRQKSTFFILLSARYIHSFSPPPPASVSTSSSTTTASSSTTCAAASSSSWRDVVVIPIDPAGAGVRPARSAAIVDIHPVVVIVVGIVAIVPTTAAAGTTCRGRHAAGAAPLPPAGCSSRSSTWSSGSHIIIVVAPHDGIQVVKVVEVLLEAGPVQVGPGRGDVGIVVGQEVGVGIGGLSSRIGVLLVGILRVLGGRNLFKVLLGQEEF